MSLMQMAKTSAALERLSAKGLPFVSVMTDPTMVVFLQVWQCLAISTLVSLKALIGFAGRRVIRQAVREDLLKVSNTSEFLLDHGAIDMIVDSAVRCVSALQALLLK